ncbi:RICIN domain-containing protein [Streptomyces sp. CoH27]|uniref:RICIN domain-containing protein n=1 Tax=Streptomyces sp. CoH27 TaxID=2875763 RepID=UPI0035A97E84
MAGNGGNTYVATGPPHNDVLTGNVPVSGTNWPQGAQQVIHQAGVPVSGGYGHLRAQNSGHVVAVSGGSTAAGTPDIVQQAPDGTASSLWLPVRQSDGSCSFQNKNSDLCLDVYGGGSDLGRQLDQRPCKNTGGNNQDFTPLR